MKLGYVLKYVDDLAATVEFYEKAFGIKRRFLHESGTYAELDTGETALGFVSAKFAAENKIPFEKIRPDRSAPGIEIGLVTESAAEVQAAFDRAVRAGAKVVTEPHAKPWGQVVSYVRDLNGFLVEICSPVN
jgi:uncharacterized glyoxalase superfamily protein PhnB